MANSKRRQHLYPSIGAEFARGAAASAIGAGTTIGAISSAGIGGFSAAGITTGLATLGAGSLLSGAIVAPALGYGVYRISKWLLTPTEPPGKRAGGPSSP